jgi:hypothetical protein
MPYLKSLYRSLPLSTRTINYYDWLLGRPELKAWPNYTVHIDAVTGDHRRFHAVLDRLEQAATVLASSPDDGGLGFAAGRPGIVGILSENCLVCAKSSLTIVCPLTRNRDLSLSRNFQFSRLRFSR